MQHPWEIQGEDSRWECLHLSTSIMHLSLRFLMWTSVFTKMRADRRHQSWFVCKQLVGTASCSQLECTCMWCISVCVCVLSTLSVIWIFVQTLLSLEIQQRACIIVQPVCAKVLLSLRLTLPPSECFPVPLGDVKRKEYQGNVSSGRSPCLLMVPSLKQTAVCPLASLHLMSSSCYSAPNLKIHRFD